MIGDQSEFMIKIDREIRIRNLFKHSILYQRYDIE